MFLLMIRCGFARNIEAHLEFIGTMWFHYVVIPTTFQSSVHPLLIVVGLNCRCVLGLNGFRLAEGKLFLFNFRFSFKKWHPKFRLCSKHRKMMSITEDSHSTSMESHWASESEFMIEDTRDSMNRILAEASISPIRSQTRSTLQHQSKSSLRRLLSKLNRGTDSLRSMIYIHQ